MRPQPNPRVVGAMMALAALTVITILSVTAATAKSQTAHTASVADIQPRRSVLNVMAGRRASVAGTVAPGDAGRRVVAAEAPRQPLVHRRPRRHRRRGQRSASATGRRARRARRCASSPGATASASAA